MPIQTSEIRSAAAGAAVPLSPDPAEDMDRAARLAAGLCVMPFTLGGDPEQPEDEAEDLDEDEDDDDDDDDEDDDEEDDEEDDEDEDEDEDEEAEEEK